MATIEIPQELLSELQQISDRSGTAVRELISNTLRDFIAAIKEEREDLRIAEERMANPGRRLTLEEVEEQCGLDG